MMTRLAKRIGSGLGVAAASCFLIIFQPLGAQIVPRAITSPADEWSYADIADVFGSAPVIARVRVRDAIVLKGSAARAGTIRTYLTGDIMALIRAPGALPPRIAWLADVPLDSRGRMPKLKKAEVILAATPAAIPAGSIRLVTRDSMVAWSPMLEPRVRALVTELSATGAVPAIVGVSSAFHTAGAVAGEGETQVFLSTAGEAVMSLNILRRPGEPPRWAFAPGEIVDEAATTPRVDTLPWYRLACFLPKRLPEAATAELGPSDAEAARRDYGLVIEGLGPCPRTRT